ncbi:LysR family transcriptional regulator [Streptomyces guryensis]|uniref:LysR family transcriptional regulator n=1 Tax=Streptomyces guryensis TaxID=2886947 RepID=UPI003558C811
MWWPSASNPWCGWEPTAWHGVAGPRPRRRDSSRRASAGLAHLNGHRHDAVIWSLLRRSCTTSSTNRALVSSSPLRMIRAIDDAGSVTRAADRLGLAQSAFSSRLKRIEAAVGGKLFERGREGVQPTPLGVLVLERSRVPLPAMRQLQEDALRFATAAREDSELHLGATHGPFLGALVDRLATARPELAGVS